MTCLGVLERGERGDGNETGLKEEGGIEMSIYRVLFHIRDCTRSLFALKYLPCLFKEDTARLLRSCISISIFCIRARLADSRFSFARIRR